MHKTLPGVTAGHAESGPGAGDGMGSSTEGSVQCGRVRFRPRSEQRRPRDADWNAAVRMQEVWNLNKA